MKRSITVQEFHAHVGADASVCKLDVRSAAEYATGHIPGFVNIPMEEIEARMADVPEAPLLVVCESGKRAEIVAGWLAGRREVMSLEGGTRAWRNLGHPLVTCSPCRWSLERQVRLVAGLLVLIGALLTAWVSPGWVYLPMFIGAGLTFAAVTQICGMAILLSKMPWNSQAKPKSDFKATQGADCCT
jgi:rhodanese-related sulfurtransferase